ncbi:uncharacterized protein LOC121986078 [Zingiber officinale]|uniref:uncharacterized protein LOC121986078 n=1 Tax=Zingiber officinale TaxID=94328 RepID=UPI001C4BFA00|nr:uncharacterized protein LOC121986078 [Zingiber officinale]
MRNFQKQEKSRAKIVSWAERFLGFGWSATSRAVAATKLVDDDNLPIPLSTSSVVQRRGGLLPWPVLHRRSSSGLSSIGEAAIGSSRLNSTFCTETKFTDHKLTFDAAFITRHTRNFK